MLALKVAVVDHPLDPLAHLALADWYEEQGDTASAGYRRQVAVVAGAAVAIEAVAREWTEGERADLLPLVQQIVRNASDGLHRLALQQAQSLAGHTSPVVARFRIAVQDLHVLALMGVYL